jgi:benzoyl-CoA reductase/2-hydroxyglutaryl-CoA dehydratase subunit BcrC/BadD/HgdB
VGSLLLGTRLGVLLDFRTGDGSRSTLELEISVSGDEDYSEEDAAKLVQAYLTFTSQFSDYIRSVDIDLWNKAIDFAKDYTNIDGVILNDVRHLMDFDRGDKNEEA